MSDEIVFRSLSDVAVYAESCAHLELKEPPDRVSAIHRMVWKHAQCAQDLDDFIMAVQFRRGWLRCNGWDDELSVFDWYLDHVVIPDE